MTANNLTQVQYNRLINTLARVLQTQRRFFTLLRIIPLEEDKTAYSVSLRGFRYIVTLSGNKVAEVAREI